MSAESAYESARQLALTWWHSTPAATSAIDDGAADAFAAEYAAYVDELPPLRYPDSPPLSPADYAAENSPLAL